MNHDLSPAGWIFLGITWGVICSVTVYCFWRILYPRNQMARKNIKETSGLTRENDNYFSESNKLTEKGE